VLVERDWREVDFEVEGARGLSLAARSIFRVRFCIYAHSHGAFLSSCRSSYISHLRYSCIFTTAWYCVMAEPETYISW
jgi:hypothetical protein